MLVDDQSPQASARRHKRPSRDAEGETTARDWRSLHLRLAPHAPALAVYAVLALVVMHGLLLHPSGREFSGDYGDEIGFEWFFTAIAHQVVHLHNPLFTPQMGAPLGVNLMGNPTLPVIAVLVTPLTLGLGGPVVIAWLLLLNLFATAAAWYWFFLKHPVPGSDPNTTAYRVAAALGAGLCGFSPAMIAHTIGHPDLSAQWLIPLIAHRVLTLLSSKRPLRSGALLGLVVAIGVGIGEEIVFLTFVGLAAVFLLWALNHPRDLVAPAMNLLKGAATALAVAVPLLAYPLWFQFKGTQSYSGSPWLPSRYPANLQSYLDYSPFAWGGSSSTITTLTPGTNEATAYVGIPVLVLVLAIVVWRRSDPRVRTAALAAIILAFCSLGVKPAFGTHTLLSSSPWSLLINLPGFNESLPVRLSFDVFPLVAYILVVGVAEAAKRSRAVVWGAGIAVAAVLAPMVPSPIAVQDRVPTPTFFSAGLWRQCMPSGGTLFAFPFGEPLMQFAAIARDEFPIVSGSYLGPATGTHAFGWPTDRPTQALLTTADNSGTVPAVTAQVRSQAAADLAYWHASCIALYAPGTSYAGQSVPAAASSPVKHPATDLKLLTTLFGAPKLIGGMWTWQVPGH
jgi:hypothetical protein